MGKLQNHVNRLIEKHQMLKKEVTQLEMTHASDYAIRETKKKKLRLKDEIDRMQTLEKFYPSSF
jgi:uncharacterized protein YdcH (DUF465 family)